MPMVFLWQYTNNCSKKWKLFELPYLNLFSLRSDYLFLIWKCIHFLIMTLKGSTAPRPNCDSAEHPKGTGPKMVRLYNRVNHKFVPAAWIYPGCQLVKIDWYNKFIPINTLWHLSGTLCQKGMVLPSSSANRTRLWEASKEIRVGYHKPGKILWDHSLLKLYLCVLRVYPNALS